MVCRCQDESLIVWHLRYKVYRWNCLDTYTYATLSIYSVDSTANTMS